jgi:hypothetical protein
VRQNGPPEEEDNAGGHQYCLGRFRKILPAHKVISNPQAPRKQASL